MRNSTCSRRRWAQAGAVIATMVAVALLNPSLAQASAAQGVISGSGVVTDDFGDEATLSTTSFSSSNAVGLWQQILVSERLLDDSDVDCEFGPATKAATVKFQSRYGLTADGVVGTNTWSKADNYLTIIGTDENESGIDYNSPNSYAVAYFRRELSNGYYVEYLNGYTEIAYNTKKSQYC